VHKRLDSAGPRCGARTVEYEPSPRTSPNSKSAYDTPLLRSPPFADALRPARTREAARERCGLGGTLGPTLAPPVSSRRWTGGGRALRGVAGPALIALGLVGRSSAAGPSRSAGARGGRAACSSSSASGANSLSDEDEMTDAFRLSSASVGRARTASSASVMEGGIVEGARLPSPPPLSAFGPINSFA
jgi:hypothetical protein